MEDTVTDIEQDVQTEQEPTPKLKVKEFAAKIKAKYPEYKDIDDKELTDKIVAKYPEYKDQIDFSVEVKKKEVGSNGLPTPSGNGLSGTPKDEVVIKAEPIKPTEPIEASLQADELSKRTKKQYVAGGELGSTEIIVPDEEAKKEAQLLRDEIKVKYGYDADELASEHKGLKPSDYGREGFGKEELLIDKNENPQLYQRKLGRLKWQSGFESVLADNLVNGHITSEEYNGINNAIQSSLENASVGDYVQQRENINYVANAIKQYGGLDKDKILKDYAVEVGKVYGNSYKSLSAQKKQETPESKFLNPDAELGLQYLRDIDPEKAKQYDRLFVDPKKLEGDALKGYNHLMQTLEETSIGLQDNAVTEDLNNLSNIAKRNNGLTPEQLEQAKILEAKKDEIEKKKLELDQKYPDRIEDKIDDAVQEVLGQRLGWGNYAGGMTGKAIKNTAQGIWESVSEPFMSDASNSMRELAIMGESLGESKLYNKTDANKSFQTDQLIFKPELQAEVDLIKNDKSLTREQKEAKLYPLLKENKDDFGRVPIQGGKFNVSPSSILYGVTDIGTTLLPFIGLEALTGGIGGAGTAARFLRTFTAAAATSFHDEYANAISEGKPQSEAYKQAMGMTAITSAGMAGAGTAEKVRAFYGSSKSSASKIIKGMSDDQIEYVLDAAKLPKVLKPFLSIGERGIATPKMFAKGAKTGAEFELAMGLANEAKHQIYDTPIDREQNFKQSLLGIANFGLLGAGLGHIGYKSPTELQKSGFSEMGKNPEEFHLAAKQMLKDGQLTKQEFDHRTLLIDKSAEAQKTLPKANAKGKPLSEKEQSDYIYNSVIKNEGKKAASNLPPVQAEKAEHTALVADFKNDLILEPKTDAQLESRENALEKVLEPKKDADGKTIELNEKVEKEAKAELQAINEVIQEQKQEEQPQPEVIVPSTEVKSEDIENNLDVITKVLDSQKNKSGEETVYLPNTNIINDVKKANVGDEIIINVPVDKYLYGHDSEKFPSVKHDSGFEPTSKREIKEPITLNVESVENPFLEATDGNNRIVQARFNKDKTIPARIKVTKELKEQADNFDYNKSISEAYNKAKKDGSNPELVKAVEEALTPKSEPQPSTVKSEEVKPEINSDGEILWENEYGNKGVNVVFEENYKPKNEYEITGEENGKPDNHSVLISGTSKSGRFRMVEIEEHGGGTTLAGTGRKYEGDYYVRGNFASRNISATHLTYEQAKALAYKLLDNVINDDTIVQTEVEFKPTQNEQKTQAEINQPAKSVQGDITTPEVATQELFTEGKDLNKMFADLKSKYGDKKGSELYEVANRLVNPNKNTIVEIRSNGVVVKEGDKYILKPFGNTDANSKKWVLYKGLDVTDQFQKSEPQPSTVKSEEVKAVKNSDGTITIKHGDGLVTLRDAAHAENYSKKAGITLKFVDKLDVPKEEIKSEKQSAQSDNTLQSSIDKFDNVENYTIEDLVNDAEVIANENGNKKISDAVENYRKEQEEDRKLSGRSDMDAANDKIEKIIREESKSENKPIQNEQAKESKVPGTEKKASPTTESVSKVEQPTGEAKKDIGTKARELASKLESGEKSVLPSWMKAKLPPGTKLSGIDIDKAYANALRTFADIHDATKNFAKAIEEGFKHIKEWFKENNIDIDEAEMKASFENEVKGRKEGITHEAIAEVREQIGLAEYEGLPKDTHEALLEEARKEIEKNPNAANESMEKMERGDKVTNKDNAILAVYKAALDIELRDNPSKEVFERVTRLAKALDPAGSEAGKLLESRKLFSRGDSLSDFLLGRQEDKGVPLSDRQIKEETAKYNELQKANEELQAALKVEQEKNAKLIAEIGLNKAKARIKKASKKTHEEYVQERKDAVNGAREALKKLRGQAAVRIPLVNELAAIAPHVKKAVQSLFNEGVDKLDDIVTAIHADFKDVLEGISKADIMNIIGGVHDEVRKTENEKAAELRLIKREAELLAKLQKERLNEKSTKPKTDREETDQTRRIIDLQNKIKEVRKLNKERGLEEPVEDVTATDPEENAKLQKKLTKRIEELQADLKNKNYAKPAPPKKPFVLSRRSQLLKDRVIQLEKKIAEERFLDERSKLTGWEKAWDKFQNVAGIRRVVQTAIDASIWLRQLGALSLNPRRWDIAKKFIVAGSKSVFSQVHYDRIMDAIHKSEDFKKSLEDGVRYNELNEIHPSQQNEFFPKSFVYKIPIIREMITASQRIADASLNTARYELYQKHKSRLIKKGITRESDPETYKEMGKLVMNTTGSGNLLGMLENKKAEKVLGATFYGARLMAANFNTLNPVYYARIFGTNRQLGREAMIDLASYTTTIVATTLALAAAGGKVSLDPDDGDFLQVRFGDKVYDLTGGKAAYIRTYLRWVEAGYARATKSKHEANKALEFAGKSTLNFWRNKLAPNTGYAMNALSGKSSIGQDFDPYEIAKIYPMYADEAYKAAKEDGFSSLLTVIAPNLAGIGYGNYYSEPSQKPLEETLQRNTRSDELDLETMQNYKEGGRDITEKEKDEYIKERDDYIENEIKKLYEGTSTENLVINENNKVVTKKYSEMSPKEIVKATSAIKAKATLKTKKKLFGEESDMRQSDNKLRGEGELKAGKAKLEYENR